MLEPKRFTIPNVNYEALMPNLERTRYTTKNMITNLNNKGFEDVLNLILPNDYESKNPNEIVGFLFDSTCCVQPISATHLFFSSSIGLLYLNQQTITKIHQVEI